MVEPERVREIAKIVEGMRKTRIKSFYIEAVKGRVSMSDTEIEDILDVLVGEGIICKQYELRCPNDWTVVKIEDCLDDGEDELECPCCNGVFSLGEVDVCNKYFINYA